MNLPPASTLSDDVLDVGRTWVLWLHHIIIVTVYRINKTSIGGNAAKNANNAITFTRVEEIPLHGVRIGACININI